MHSDMFGLTRPRRKAVDLSPSDCDCLPCWYAPWYLMYDGDSLQRPVTSGFGSYRRALRDIVNRPQLLKSVQIHRVWTNGIPNTAKTVLSDSLLCPSLVIPSSDWIVELYAQYFLFTLGTPGFHSSSRPSLLVCVLLLPFCYHCCSYCSYYYC